MFKVSGLHVAGRVIFIAATAAPLRTVVKNPPSAMVRLGVLLLQGGSTVNEMTEAVTEVNVRLLLEQEMEKRVAFTRGTTSSSDSVDEYCRYTVMFSTAPLLRRSALEIWHGVEYSKPRVK